MAAPNLRIKVSKKVNETITLAKLIIAKHQADGASSILNNIDMADFINKTAIAETEHNRMEQLKKDAELATQNRNLALGIAKQQQSITPGTVIFFVKTCRDILKGHNKGKESQIGEWGFEVNTSPKPKKVKNSP